MQDVGNRSKVDGGSELLFNPHTCPLSREACRLQSLSSSVEIFLPAGGHGQFPFIQTRSCLYGVWTLIKNVLSNDLTSAGRPLLFFQMYFPSWIFSREKVPIENNRVRASACLSIREETERKITTLVTHSRKSMNMSVSSSGGTSWIYEKPLYWVHRICFYVLKWGSMPKHIAFVMDGNRRYAKKLGANRAAGHQEGFSKLTETLQWCLDLNVLEVTVFAFSIENFKRSEEEVNTLMDLAKEKFRNLIEDWRKLQEHGICVRVMGNLTLLPKDLITLIMIAMLLTKDNKHAFLNIAFSYTSKEEMSNTSSQIVYGFRNGRICESEISENLFDQCLYTHYSPSPELIVRTSGEHRLSDFLMWQSSQSYIHFAKVLWPEFSPWNLMSAIFCYQHFINKLVKPFRKEPPINTENISPFINILHEERVRILYDLCASNGHSMNWEKLKSISSEDLYEYYKTHFKA